MPSATSGQGTLWTRCSCQGKILMRVFKEHYFLVFFLQKHCYLVGYRINEDFLFPIYYACLCQVLVKQIISLSLSYLIFLFCHIWTVIKAYSWLYIHGSLLVDLRIDMGSWRQNTGWLWAGQVPYLLNYCLFLMISLSEIQVSYFNQYFSTMDTMQGSKIFKRTTSKIK